jgi:hypothetical protein
VKSLIFVVSRHRRPAHDGEDTVATDGNCSRHKQRNNGVHMLTPESFAFLEASLCHEDGCAGKLTRAQAGEGLVRLIERKGLCLYAERKMGYYFEEFLGIGACEVCHRAKRSFLPKFLVGEGGYVTHMNASTDYDAAFIDSTQGGWNQGTGRSKDYRRVELGWGWLIGIASPNCTETPRECLGALIPRSGKRKDLALLEASNLRNNMGSGAESINAEAPRIARLPKRAIPNQPGTEERSSGDIIKRVGKAVAKVSMCEGEFGVTTILCVACEASVLTEIFTTRSAISALAAGRSQPGNSDAIAKLESLNSLAKPLDPTDDFMAGNQGKLWIGQLAIDNVQIGSADSTRSDAHEHFFWTRVSDRHRTSDKRPARSLQDHRVHESFLAQNAQGRNTRSLFG